MKKIFTSLYLLLIFTGCESFVENTSSSISYVTDEEINDTANIPFLVNGVFCRILDDVTIKNADVSKNFVEICIKLDIF